MYYNDFARIKRMERMLEKLAYFSIVLDFMVAVATLFVLNGAKYSSFVLTISNYLLAIEVAIAVVVFGALVATKHYRKIIDTVAMTTFRNKYNAPIHKVSLLVLLKRLLQIVLSPFASTR